MDKENRADSPILIITIGLGIFSFFILLAYHNIADGDLWARLVQGASIWKRHSLVHRDIFAFTAVLPKYIDHEWGAGLIFFSLLRFFGPASLLLFKIITALTALALAVLTGRMSGCKWQALLLLAVPCAATIFPAYSLVVRSHTMTYLFFAATILCMEIIRRGHSWPFFAVVTIMMLWTNVHGGFVSGLGVIAIYTFISVIEKHMRRIMLVTMLAAISVTFINPYGIELWNYLVPAFTMRRKYVTEWQAMPLGIYDAFIGFRVLFIATICMLMVAWSRVNWRRSIPGLCILAITAYLALRHRRHAPFFGLSAAAFVGPYMEKTLDRLACHVPGIFLRKARPVVYIFILYGAIAVLTAWRVLPNVSLRVLAPVGAYPVREADILMYSKATGNLAVTFRWGNYAMWRLYPRVKISICGRYEAMYPESTYAMNDAFFFKIGSDWDRLVRQYHVDYIMLDTRRTRLQKKDLENIDFKIVYSGDCSALYARKELAPLLKSVAEQMPERTIEPLDAGIPDSWWDKEVPD
ncbi:MAG: hypothetical protein A2Z72_00660 [Omnitrophica bacterium RBG_13_46_9]|nr:MAG: hypothetical protein A2Z72_00660 [Omnitrophica bacterium RBG_13_46_9]